MTGDNPYASSVKSELFGKSLFWKTSMLIKILSTNIHSDMKPICWLVYLFQFEPIFNGDIDIDIYFTYTQFCPPEALALHHTQ